MSWLLLVCLASVPAHAPPLPAHGVVVSCPDAPTGNCASGSRVPRGADAQAVPTRGAEPAPAATRSAATRFLRDLAGDFRRLATRDPALGLGLGGLAAGLVHARDDEITSAASEAGTSVRDAFNPGNVLGNAAVQVPVALGAWIVGHAAGNDSLASFGRELVQAQVVSGSLTQAVKVTTGRTRPNGGRFSLPSGHTSLTFATAAIVERHFGWKLGIPSFAVASYVAAARVVWLEHWTSDVVFGAAVGVASARTIEVRHGHAVFTVVPTLVPGGMAVMVSRHGAGSGP